VANFKMMADACNKLIDSENAIVCALNILKSSNSEAEWTLKSVKASNAKCQEYMGLYDEYTERIEGINNQFKLRWDWFESKCTEWTTHELAAWLHYKSEMLYLRDIESIEWDSVEEIMTNHNLCGIHLPHLGGKMLSVIGLSDEVSDALVPVINELAESQTADFKTLWMEKEMKWSEWTADDIMEWLRYQCLLFDHETIDWNKTSDLLKGQNANGKMLLKFNDVLLRFMGFTDDKIVQHLVSTIEAMLSKSGDTNESLSSKSSAKMTPSNTSSNLGIMASISVDIPPRFTGPITKEIMKDPVIAFDGNTYERTAIENYLKEHNKSPVTGAVAAHTIVIPNNAIKQLIEEFLGANGLKARHQVEKSQDLVETGYL